MNKKELDHPCVESPCLTRRQFLAAGGGVTATVLLSSVFPGTAFGDRKVKFSRYPEKKIATVSQLKTNVPVSFSYPYNDLHSSCFVIKLGAPAGGGVGRGRDIVAFNYLCTHMGGPLMGTYKAEHKVLGPCPFHLSTFDLTRHGMVVAGHATAPLPQIVLEVRGREIYATGIVGLMYGYSDNLRSKA
ncbi:MAG: arsenate reductase (azurin) small subunit [Candidatus Methylomirabilales bacterium]